MDMSISYDSEAITPSGNEGVLYVINGCKTIVKIDVECMTDVEKNGYFYMLSPFSDNEAVVRMNRFLENARLLNYFTGVRIPVLSTVSHSYPATLFNSDDSGWYHWEKLEKALIEGSKALLLVLLHGWDRSVGVKQALEHAEILQIPLNILVNYTGSKLYQNKSIYHMIKTDYNTLKHLRNIRKTED